MVVVAGVASRRMLAAWCVATIAEAVGREVVRSSVKALCAFAAGEALAMLEPRAWGTSETSRLECRAGNWSRHNCSEREVVEFLQSRKTSSAFAGLFSDGGFAEGVVVRGKPGFTAKLLGAGGRWTLIQPERHEILRRCLGADGTSHRVVRGARSRALRRLKTSPDFVYLDGSYSDEVIGAAWSSLEPGGVLAGSGYCSAGDRGER
mmetsp:Transcript_3871/g.11860  ORF Transcript_3871/g.11860 Transcript_3871/m.11860 type:complete len:206 (-) Transcript_3871:21-638(-)